MTDFEKFIAQPFNGQKFIAHCYDPSDVEENVTEEEMQTAETNIHLTARNFLGDLLNSTCDSLVLIGPEGDFSVKEVKMAISAGFKPISLGESRLRTETAALVAVHLMYLAKRR